MRVETATIRPFSGLDRLEVLFRERILGTLGALQFESAPMPTFVEEDLGAAKPDLAIIFASDGADAEPRSFRETLDTLVGELNSPGLREKLRLVIVARSVSLRYSRTLFTAGLDEALPEVVDVRRDADDVRLALQDRRGFDLRVALVLIDDLKDADPLTPALAGTWLAQTRFRVRPQPNRGGFAPQELTPEVRRQFSLPEGTLSFVAVERDALLGADDLSEVAVHYWDPDVLNLVQVRPKDDIARYVQEAMAVELLTSIAGAIAHAVKAEGGMEAGIEVLKEYPAAEDFMEEISDLLASDPKVLRTPSDILRLASEDLPKLKALIEGEFGVKQVLVDSLRSYQ